MSDAGVQLLEKLEQLKFIVKAGVEQSSVTPTANEAPMNKSEQESVRVEILMYYGSMMGCYAAMPEPEKLALHKWERHSLPASDRRATSDWPGWERYIGKFPVADVEPEKRKRPISNALRFRVYERDGFACVTCSRRDELTMDHIVAESKGGPGTLDNLQTLCRSCNCTKGAR